MIDSTDYGGWEHKGVRLWPCYLSVIRLQMLGLVADESGDDSASTANRRCQPRLLTSTKHLPMKG